MWQRQPFTFDEAFAASNITKYNGTDYYAMQDIDSTICERVYPLDQTTTLIDKRDNKTYTVAKLKMTPDGSTSTCWMTQNLALSLSTSQQLTSENTDLNEASGGVTLVDGVYRFTPERNTTTTLNKTNFPADNYNPYSYNPSNASYGVYYNFTAAIASNDSSNLTRQYQNAPNSICPKKWRLPMVYNGTVSNFSNEFGSLLYSYSIISSPATTVWSANGINKAKSSPLFLVGSGAVNNGSLSLLGNCYLHPSTIDSSTGNYWIGFTTDAVGVKDLTEKSHAHTVRCILR